MPEEDDYGRRRAADFEFGLTGGKALPTTQEPTAFEKKLLEAGITQRDLDDTVRAINWTVEQTGLKAHPAEQEKGVKLCMGAAGNEAQVREITNMVVDGMLKKGPGMKVEAGGIKMGAPKQTQFKI